MAEKPEDRKTVGWLQEQLIELLAAARTGADIDHAACAKYADLLYKMLPKGDSEKTKAIGQQVREEMKREGEG